MKKKKANEELYKFYFDGDDFCVQDSIGFWHVAIYDQNGNFDVMDVDKKPHRFSKFELLTQKEIVKRNLSITFLMRQQANQLIEGKRSFLEAREALAAESDFLRLLKDKGCEIIEPIKDGFIIYITPMKPYNPNVSTEGDELKIRNIKPNIFARLKQKFLDFFRLT